MRALAVGLGVMLVDEGGADGEARGDSACNSVELQLVGVAARLFRAWARVEIGHKVTSKY